MNTIRPEYIGKTEGGWLFAAKGLSVGEAFKHKGYRYTVLKVEDGVVLTSGEYDCTAGPLRNRFWET